MKNLFYKKALSENFDSLRAKEIVFKRNLHWLMKPIIKVSNKKRVVVERYPLLEKGEPYIFAAGHSFPDEIAANLSVIDRHTYVLIGTRDQVINNFGMTFLWINGMIYVDKLEKSSRRDSFQRMKKVLMNGSSVMLFPEGVINNSENKLCNDVFPGFYHLAVETEKKVIPVVSQTYNDSKIIRVIAGNPMDISCYTKEEAKNWLKDEIASFRYEMLLKDPLLCRSKMTGDLRLWWMRERKTTYMEVQWTEDVFDMELQGYHDEKNPTPQEVRASFDRVCISPKNASILADIIRQRELDKKYDFVSYMHRTWNLND